MITDNEILKHHAPSVMPRARIELRIVRRLLHALLKHGYQVTMDDGDSLAKLAVEHPRLDLALKHIFNFDEMHLTCWTKEGGTTFVLLVFGNDGDDVICDYGMSLEPIINAVLKG
jgi:hypothetical protein